MHEQETPLSGGNVNAGISRIGDTVRRSQSKASGQIHALLLHLERQGFGASPRFLGVDRKGREILSFVPGETDVASSDWLGETSLIAAAKLLRAYHDATVDFLPSASTDWAYRHPDPAQHEVICHNDFAPYNLSFENSNPVGIFDFDLAGPGPRLRDIAYLAFWMVPLAFHADDLQNAANTDLKDGSRRLKLFCATYDIPCDRNLVLAIQERLASMHDTSIMEQMIGREAALRLEQGGHLDYWKAEATAFDLNFNRISQNLE